MIETDSHYATQEVLKAFLSIGVQSILACLQQARISMSQPRRTICTHAANVSCAALGSNKAFIASFQMSTSSYVRYSSKSLNIISCYPPVMNQFQHVTVMKLITLLWLSRQNDSGDWWSHTYHYSPLYRRHLQSKQASALPIKVKSPYQIQFFRLPRQLSNYNRYLMTCICTSNPLKLMCDIWSKIRVSRLYWKNINYSHI